MEKRALVRNAGDSQQVKRAASREAFNRDNELNDLRAVLETPAGRRLLWRLMGFCRVFETVWEPSAKIHYNSGQQDVGHFVQAEIIEAGEDYYFKMMKENKKSERESNV